MAQLAIKGHSTKGNEVITLLEMLGGINEQEYDGANSCVWYCIDGLNEITPFTHTFNLDNHKFFTLEEFLEKFPYKVGDKVLAYCEGIFARFTIQDMRWCYELNRVEYKICSSWCDTSLMRPYKEETMEENIKEKCDLINFNSHYIFDFADRVELVLKDDWEVKSENGKTFVVRKRPQYPKTYVDCAKILDCFGTSYIDGYKSELLEKLQELLICRDAYWKIAGDWKAEFRFGKKKYCIMTKDNKVISATVEETNRVFVFPTEEMRDAFYENFKELIEECKELL